MSLSLFTNSKYLCAVNEPAIMDEKIKVKFLQRRANLAEMAIWTHKRPRILYMEEFDYSSKSDRFSRARKGKLRERSKKETKKTNRLSSIERDYIENVSSADEEFSCLGENELLESLNKLNFSLPDSENETKMKYAENSLSSKSIDNSEYYPVDNFSQLNRDIKLFLKDEDELFETSPAAPEVRRFIHLLGNLYRLKTFSVGKGHEKRIVIQKTEFSGLANNTRQLEKVIEQGNKAVKWCDNELEPKEKNNSSRKGNVNSRNLSAKPADGTIVGEKSAPIKEDNVGNKMLQKMGWTPGTGLGRESSGIVNHIPAIIKTKRTGLI